MNNLNTILVEGNLTRDPELSITKNEVAVCNLSVATNRYYKVEEKYEQEVSYFDIETWGKTAEACQKYLKQGRGVRITGRIKQDRWNDKEGNKRSKIKIIAENVEFGPEKKKDKAEEAYEPDTTINEAIMEEAGIF